MSVLRRTFLVLCCVFLFSGCYEDEVELTINRDGSGTIKQKLVFSERFMVAKEKKGQDTPVPDKEELVKNIGSAIDITSLKQTDLPDGRRVIEVEGTFSRPEQFFLSEYCQKQIKLRIAPAGKGKATIYCDMGQFNNDDRPGPGLTEIYGLTKGLYIKRSIHLPVEIEKTNGYSDKAKNTVSWVTDLRNKQGLSETKAFIEGADGGKGFAVFNTSGLKFTLPLKVTAMPEQAVAVEEEKAQKGSAGFAAKVSWVSLKKKMTTDGTSAPEILDLEFGVEISWNEGYYPIRCERPVLLNLSDDQNNDLVSDKFPSAFQGQIFSYENNNKKKQLTFRAATPSITARKLKNLEGYIEVITDTVKERVVLENIQELAGKDSTGNPILDRLNFRIKSIDAHTLEIEINGGSKTITSLDILKEDGSKVKRRGGWGGGNGYSYSFGEDISKLAKCELEVVVTESKVKVPFSLGEISLP